MIHRLSKSGHFIKITLLVSLALVFWLKTIFSHEQSLIDSIENSLIFGNITIPKALLLLITFFLVILQAIYIYSLSIKHKLLPSKSVYLPLVYVLMMSWHPDVLVQYPAIMANFLVLFSLDLLLSSLQSIQIIRLSFYAGFIMAIASLFYFPVIFLFPLFWFVFYIYKNAVWRSWIIILIGFLLPFAFFFTFHLLKDNLSGILETYHSFFTHIEIIAIQNNTTFLIFWGVVFLLFVYSFFFTSVNFRIQNIDFRRNLSAVIFLGLLCIALIIFYSTGHNALPFAIAASIVISSFLQAQKNKWISDLIVLLLLLIVVYNYFI